ncbi:MAG: 50S ribosomal protein L35 [Oscillospiraceae bacterium]|jgi:large subunit ribosomal protein L35|nr:50S ribosomal protein L35 [Oscillospiraceae bacterium]MDR2656996.1 50S ribosomal protein L35 [Oscillospiraceae bacterium]
MPKQKTHKGAAKRFRVTKSGLLKRASAFRNHMMGHKTAKQKRNLRNGGYVDQTQAGTMKKLIPYA